MTGKQTEEIGARGESAKEKRKKERTEKASNNKQTKQMANKNREFRIVKKMNMTRVENAWHNNN